MSQKQRGIALIQVLLLTAIFSILGLYLTSTARDQVQVAQWASDKTRALIELHSAESEMLFKLLTESKNTGNNSFSSSVSSPWNFHNAPFSVNDNVSVKMQDQAGLINIHFPDKGRLKALLLSSDVSDVQANRIIDSILDWQDLDSSPRTNGREVLRENVAQKAIGSRVRNGAVPNLHDLSFIGDIPENKLRLLLDNTTIYRKGPFNPTNAPYELLVAISDSSTAREVVRLREMNQLTKRNFSQLTRINEGDDIFFYPSNYLVINFISEVGESSVTKKLAVHIMPYAKDENRPFDILSTHW